MRHYDHLGQLRYPDDARALTSEASPPLADTATPDIEVAVEVAVVADASDAPDPSAAILQAGAALLQGLAASRGADGAGSGKTPIAIERDPVTGQASIRVPLPEPAAHGDAHARHASATSTPPPRTRRPAAPSGGSGHTQ